MTIAIAYDLDGVLCVDHPKSIGAGDEEYEDHIDFAEPLIIPQGFCYVVTGRMETYRERTEKWLKRYGVDCELIMKPLKLAGIEKTPGFKAAWYKQSDAKLFVESDARQAQAIALLSGKPVFSIESKKIIATGGAKRTTGGK